MKKKINTTMQSECEISIIPVTGGQTPFLKWTEYSSELEADTSWNEHYTTDSDIGVIGDTVSGNLECIELNTNNNLMVTTMNSMPINNSEEKECITKYGKSM